MKKIVLLLSIIILVSCSNEEEFNIQQSKKENIEKAPLKKQIEYTHNNLLKIGKVISKLYQQEDFKQLLFNEIDKNIINNESDDEILLIDLVEKMDIYKSNINNKDIEVLNESIRAFENIDNVDWMPAISIYNFETLNTKMQTRGTFDPTKAVIVAPVMDEPDPKGYQENEDGDLEELDFLITNDVAEDLEEIVIIRLSSAECSNSGGQELTPEEGEDENVTRSPCNGGGGGTPPIPSTVDYLRLGNTIVKYHKESWWNGRSELHFRGFWDLDFLPGDINYPGEFYTFYNNDEYGKRLRRVKRSWISNQEVLHQHSRLFWDIDNMLSVNDRNFLGYVIFEYDPWPALPKTAHLPPLPSGQVRTIKYRSNQYYYDRNWVEVSNYADKIFDNAFTHQVNNNSIEYVFYRDIN